MSECLEITRIESLQPPYNLFWRQVEEKVIPFCLEHDISVIPYSSLAQGLLTGKFASVEDVPKDDIRVHNRLFQEETLKVALQEVEKLREIAKRYGKTPGQTALNWALAKPGITSVIVGAKRPSQIKDNVGAVGWALSEEDSMAMDEMGERVMATLGDKNPNPFC